MKKWMQQPFCITAVDAAVFVGFGQGRPIHRDRPYHGVVIQEAGACTYAFDGGLELTLHQNEMIYLPQGANYRVYGHYTDGVGGCYAINFALADSFVHEPFLFKPGNPQAYLELFRAAERAWRTARAGDGLKCMAALYTILGSMQSEYFAVYAPRSRTAAIQPALEYIAEHYCAENISIAQLAQHCGVSEPYFRRIFQQCLGMPPSKYIASQRIARACELLRYGEHSVRAAAELCGYGDECYFSREFKKATGMSPSAYQKHCRESGTKARQEG